MNLKLRELTTTEFCIGLGVKILMGIAYGYLFLHFYNGDDTWKIHQQSVKETSLLLNNPGQFFLNEYTPLEAIRTGETLKQTLILYLNDLEYAMVVKTMALFNLISHGNYYFNVVLFNLVVFWGHYWLFRVLTNLFPEARRKLFLAIFLFLPAVFWLSGIRADGLLLFFFSLFLLSISQHKNIALAITGFAGMFIIRPQFAVLLGVALAPYWLSARLKVRPLILFFTSYTVAIIVFFTVGLQSTVIQKQKEFSRLQGTRFTMKELQPDVSSFIRALPDAINHSFLRPYPWETKNVLQLFYSLELISFWLLVILFIFKPHPEWKHRITQPVILMLLFLSVSVYIFTGYIVPFPGAIVRYKIISELLLIAVSTTLIAENVNITVLSKKPEFKR